MTIVAYRDGVLAADRQSTFNGYGYSVTKIQRLKDGSLAGAGGNSFRCRALMDWLAAGMPGDYPDPEDQCVLLVIRPDATIWRFEGCRTPMQIESEFVAIGSGEAYALAAMYLGETAERAVEVACALDDKCGKGVDVLKLKPCADLPA